ncbi:zf-HC2 domain-containing protein [Streptomyces sp. NPDC005181]|uniref:anti-sigma factor family protein n=1 Tax=Streptomyces sp. NPDC005181 TaxID=3156869 RepID=UPI0033A1C43B
MTSASEPRGRADRADPPARRGTPLMFTSPQECCTIRELLAGYALHTLAPEEAAQVCAHLTSCPACRDEHDCLAAVSAHLPLLRDALARDIGRRQQRLVPAPAEGCHTSRPQPRRRRPARAILGTPLTLTQLVSRMRASGEPGERSGRNAPGPRATGDESEGRATPQPLRPVVAPWPAASG